MARGACEKLARTRMREDVRHHALISGILRMSVSFPIAIRRIDFDAAAQRLAIV